jgi:FkbM family methyltransferase
VKSEGNTIIPCACGTFARGAWYTGLLFGYKLDTDRFDQMQPSPAPSIQSIRLPGGLQVWNAPQARFDTLFLYRENFIRRCYEQHGVTLRDGDAILDVGANVGMFALSVMQRFRQLRIYCFEPVPNTYACLTRNVTESRLGGGHEVTTFNFGLGAADGQITLEFFPGAPSNSTQYSVEKRQVFTKGLGALRWLDLWKINKRAALLLLPFYPFRERLFGRGFERVMAGGTSITCEVRTLSRIIDERRLERVDLLKIDVEGAEMDVLAGIEDRHWPRIRQLAMEIEPANRPHVPALQDRLRLLGFARVETESMFHGANSGNALCMLYAVRA